MKPVTTSAGGVRADQPTPITVVWALEAVAGQIRRERPPLGEAVRLILGVVADTVLDAALMVEAEEGLSDVTP